MRRSSAPTLRAIAAHDAAGRRVHVRRLSAARVRQRAERILASTALCAISTSGTGGRPHVNTAYFAWTSGIALYFLSHPDSRHCRNLRANPAAAIAVFESTQTWGGLDRGLQLFGTCREARGAAAREAEQAYGRRFRRYAAWHRKLEPDDPARQYRFYRFVTKRVKVFDEREFGGAIFVAARVSRSRR